MKETGYLSPNFVAPERPRDIIYISYSQFSSFAKCPHYWRLCYIDKIKKKEETIHTVFGDSMHKVIQEWISILFTETVKKADEYDFSKKLKETLAEEYKNSVRKMNGVHFSSKEELIEFYIDGLDTLNYLRKKRTHFFDRRNMKLVGVELPLYAIINGVCLISYLDLVFQDKKSGKILIVDLKTSTRGWSKWEKSDEVKTSQLVLYKIFFAQQYNIPVDDIEVEYLILKRKVMADSAYPIPRVSSFKPSHGKVTQNKVMRMFNGFIQSGFIEGQYNRDTTYQAQHGRNGYNCRFCEFQDDEERCPKANRIC